MTPDISTKSSTPVSSAKKQTPAAPQLISHLPRAEKQALSVFSEIDCNHYQYGTLGLSRELLESMTCDCQYDPGQSSFSSRSLHTLVV
jgi:[histone H3]-lysine36 N-trimethyltransferase